MENYSTIPEILKDLVGNSVIGISQHDEEEYNESKGKSYVCLIFNNGSSLKIFIDRENGFEYEEV